MWTPRSGTTIAFVLRRPVTATEGLRTMLRTRFRIVFVLLVLILLIVSALFGVLTYWLEAESLPSHSPTPGSTEEGMAFRAACIEKGRLISTCSERPLSDEGDRIE